ncbi:MAG: EI24 domain-containing protein [Rhodocyclaceae bacterium]|nr:EI24 domain-containing protein [Rhodocyclaceae bacterium]
MSAVIQALARAFRSLTRGDVIWHLIWPGLASLALWAVLATVFWGSLVAGVMGWLDDWQWLASWMSDSELGAGFVMVLVHIVIGLLVLPLIYVTAALIVAAVSLPMMLEKVAATDYAAIERRAGGTQVGSVTNALSAGALFVVAMLLSLPLWLVPGLGIVIPLLLTAWLNRQAFRYDALMMHADRDEMKLIPEKNASGLMMLGVGCAALGYVPILNLFAPAFCGLAFVHYLLEALQQHRQASGWVVLDKAS